MWNWNKYSLTSTLCFLGFILAILSSSQKSGEKYTELLKFSEIKVCLLFNCLILQFAHNLGTTAPIQAGFSAKCTSPNEHFNQIENWKCYMCEFQMISLDLITNVHLSELQGKPTVITQGIQLCDIWALYSTFNYYLSFFFNSTNLIFQVKLSLWL